MVTIICGKSASGKDTLLKRLINEAGYEPIVSTTSRPMRDGETDGVEYNFTSREAFEKRIRNGDFLEYRSYNTLVGGTPDVWYYGTPKATVDALDENKDYATILDLEGARSFVDYYGEYRCVVFYMDTEDEIREQLAAKRGSFDKTEWDRRAKDDQVKFSEENLKDIIDARIRNDGKADLLKEYYVADYGREDLICHLRHQFEDYLNGLRIMDDISRDEEGELLEDFDRWADSAQAGESYYYDAQVYTLLPSY